ncbi:MAG TPA: cell envelope integrity protein TolA [Bacteroidales bacterium]|nr:cell envelope integrity protein TolA [Bacteroidales bacterium]
MNNNKFFYISIISLFILSLVSFQTYSQNYIEIEGILGVINGSPKDGSIKLYENGQLIENYTSDRSGKINVDLDLNKDYILEFSKEGYVTKKININTEMPDEYLDKRYAPIRFAVDLFQQYDEVNTVVFTQPVGIIKFYENIGDFDYDVDYSREVRTKIDKAEKELQEAHKEHLEDIQEEKKAAEEAERQRIIQEQKAAAEAKRKAEEEAKRKAAEEKARQIQLEKERAEQKRKEEEAKREAEKIRQQQIADSLKQAAKEKAQREAEEEARRKAAERARQKAEADSIRKVQEEKARLEAERKAELLAQEKAEAESRTKEEEARKEAEKIRQQQIADSLKQMAEERRKEEEAAKAQAEIEKQKRIKQDLEDRKAKAIAAEINQQKYSQNVADELSKLKKEYPEGKTVEEIEKYGMQITRTIIVGDNRIKVFLKVQHPWGETFYFRNTQCISKHLYDIEIKKL